MFYSQEHQDEIVSAVFKGLSKGFYVDVGAHDGVTISNTYHFEQKGWGGICIEPNPEVYPRLVKNRPTALCYNVAISNEDGKLPFYLNTGYTEQISGLVKHYDPRHLKRLSYEKNAYGGMTEIVHVQTQRLASVLQGVPEVHYLSIDVEGAERSVLESIDFDATFIHLIGFEANYPEATSCCEEFLRSKGYKRLAVNVQCLDVFMIHEKSPFRAGLPQ